MSWIKEKLVWFAGAIVALVAVYILGRKDGKNAEKLKRTEEVLETVKIKNRIAARVNDAPVDQLHYRD